MTELHRTGAARPAWPVRIATCGAIGYLPIPGTFGAAVGLGIVVAAARLQVSRVWLSGMVAATAGIVFAVGIWTAGEAEEFFGSKDPGPVVIDEIAGQIITLLARPDASWRWLLAGFVLFRLMDVVKPFPARRAEHLPGGWGIMTDDVAAGLYSLGGLLLLRFVIK